MSKSHPSPKKLRIQQKQRQRQSIQKDGYYFTTDSGLTFSTTGSWTMATGATVISFDTSGFRVGDCITFGAGELRPRKTKRVHPARRNREKSDGLSVVTSVATSSLTYDVAPKTRRRIKRSGWVES